MKIGRSESGQVLVLVTLSLFVLIGFVALSMDIGHLYNVRRRMQTAADAAAIAGANALQGSSSANYQQAAQDVASLNGFTNGTNNVTITVGPPASPPNPSSGSYVEVDIAQPVPTYFLGVIGYSTMNVSTRAVSGTVNNPACVYALDPSAPAAISLVGNSTINVACGIVDDSSSSSALSINGNANVTASGIGITGNYSSNGNVTITPKPTTGIAPATDPLASLAPPSAGSLQATNLSLSGNTTTTLNPGLYEGGIQIQGNATVTFNPGTYVLAGGGMSISGNATVSGTGVTFYNTSGSSAYAPINFRGNGTITLSAPTSGSMEGILFFQDRSIPTGSSGSTIVGNSNSTFDGVLYFPTTALTFFGNSSVNGYTTLVADTISVTGNSNIKLGDNYSSLADGSPIKSSTLYE